MFEKRVSVLVILMMLLTLVMPVGRSNASSPPAGWNKLRDIEIFGNSNWYEGWSGSGNGALEVVANKFPIDTQVTYNGYPSIRVNLRYSPDWWLGLMTTNLWWQTCNIERYYENGRLEFYIKGNSGGEVFYIGLQDRVKERTLGEFLTQKKLITDYINVTTDWQKVSIPLKSLINLGSGFDLTQTYVFTVEMANSNPMEFWLCDIKITSPDTEKSYPFIKVNQLGYVTDGEKYAIISGFDGVLPVGEGASFQVRKVLDNSVVYNGTLTLVRDYDQYVSGERVLKADFSSFTTEGEYYVTVSGISENSPSFRISSKEIYRPLLVDAMRYFYYQRANMELTSQYAGKYTHEAWHLDDANCPLKSDPSIKKNVSKGWYDAGDFGKYINPAATAVSDLLWAYELFPSLFTDNQFNIPESGNGIVDLLDEVRYELDFILGMQDSTTGGFYSRVFPQSKTDPRYIDDINDYGQTNVKPTSNTANAAAILAHAYLIFKDIDPTYANRLLDAAKSAWIYLENNPGNIKPPSGPYYDDSDTNDRFYAAASLFRATGEAKYNDYVKAHYQEYASKFDNPENGHGCGNMEFVAFLHYMRSPNRDATIANWWITKFNNWRNAIIARSQNSAWKNTLEGDVAETDYYWGSNGASMSSLLLIVAGSKILGDYNIDHLNAVRNNMNYILGVNPIRHSYVSGYGSDCAQYPFSSIYSEDGKSGVPKGYMAGGANGYEGKVFSNFHGKCYSDRFTEFSTNEHTIYWNSLLVFNVAAILDGSTSIPNFAGSTSYDDVGFTASDSGADICNSADQFAFVCQPVSEDNAILYHKQIPTLGRRQD